MKISISQLKPGNLSGFSFFYTPIYTQFRTKPQNKAMNFTPPKPLPLKSQNSVSGTGLHKITLFVKK